MTSQPATDPQDLTGLIEPDRLRVYLAENLPDGSADAPLEIRRHEAGYSNETFFVTRGERRLVLRRPPRGELLPTAHDVLREHRVLSGLHGTAARAPKPLLACADTSVIGAPFYVMERVEGEVIREELPAQFEPMAERRRIGEEIIDALVELHGVDPEAAELGNLGRPQGYLERQIRRWSGQLDLTLPHTRPLPGIAEATEWLKANVPESAQTTIVHGDYKLDNIVFSERAPARLEAILDWEMATLGDPLADLAWCMGYWGPAGVPPEEVEPGSNEITARPGFMTREELVARYEERSGRKMQHFQFYLCLAVWKLAIICEGLYAGYLAGTAANQRSAEHERRVPRFVERMHRIMAGEM
ncbi:MAG: phosphotransferase family protein [Dehalococcoidia bacterium]